MTKFNFFIIENELGKIEFTTDSLKPPYFIYSGEGFDGVEADISTVSNPYTQGVNVKYIKLQERVLTITAYYLVSSEFEREQIQRELYKICNPLVKTTLVFNTGYVTRKAKEVYVNKAPIFKRDVESENLDRLVEFEIDFIMPNPYFEDEKESLIYYGNVESLFEFPITIPEEGFEYSIINDNKVFNIINKGEALSPITIELNATRGEVINPFLYNLYTKETLKLDYTMRLGETIVITTETGNKSIVSNYQNSENSIFNSLNIESEFIQLQVGDNHFRIGADEGEENLEAKITYTNYWRGV